MNCFAIRVSYAKISRMEQNDPYHAYSELKSLMSTPYGNAKKRYNPKYSPRYVEGSKELREYPRLMTMVQDDSLEPDEEVSRKHLRRTHWNTIALNLSNHYVF